MVTEQNEASKAETNDKTPSEGKKNGEDSFKKPSPPIKKSADAESVDHSKPSEDVTTLILSAEEEAEVAAETNEDAVKQSTKPKASSSSSSSSQIRGKKDSQRNVWVSNISRGTKAADLKKFFSEKFTVDSAKIVTNGKSFFGYICLETAEMAQSSVKDLNGTSLGGKKISVSLQRPDIRGNKSGTVSDNRRSRDVKKDSRSNGVKKLPEKLKSGSEKTEEKKEKSAALSGSDKDAKEAPTTEGDKESSSQERIKQLQRREQRTTRIIQDLRADVKRLNMELQNNRRRLTEANRRLDAERDRKSGMRREIETMEAQLKTERRKFTQEMEQLEKKMKLDEIRYQDDRAMLNKELDECRKLREFLQRKIDDIGISRHSSHRNSPHHRSGRDSDREKLSRPSRSRMEGRGGRSPPPAPKINSRRSPRDRSPPSYKGSGGKKPRLDEPSSKHIPFGGGGSSSHHYQSQGPYSGGSSKPLLGHYPGVSSSAPRDSIYGNTSYPDPHRYGGSSSGYPSSGGGYSMSGNPAPLMSRPLGYPGSSGGQRKY